MNYYTIKGESWVFKLSMAAAYLGLNYAYCMLLKITVTGDYYIIMFSQFNMKILFYELWNMNRCGCIYEQLFL